jgi:hypothetical protein
MYWSCDHCNHWGSAETEVEAAVERINHTATHREAAEVLDVETTEPQQESVDSEDTVLDAKYLAWGITALLGLLSAHWPVLSGVVPFAALLAWILTHKSSGEDDYE